METFKIFLLLSGSEDNTILGVITKESRFLDSLLSLLCEHLLGILCWPVLTKLLSPYGVATHRLPYRCVQIEMLAILWAFCTTTNGISFLTYRLAEAHSIKGSSIEQTTCALPAWKGLLCLFAQGCDE